MAMFLRVVLIEKRIYMWKNFKRNFAMFLWIEMW